jgi:isopenicillin N synthase-like dioxygenase
MLTLLATDASPGLQIQPRAGGADGAWFDVPPRHGAFIVNLGDLLERWTNGAFLSTRHRVISTSGRERFSMPFFFGAWLAWICARVSHVRVACAYHAQSSEHAGVLLRNAWLTRACA